MALPPVVQTRAWEKWRDSMEGEYQTITPRLAFYAGWLAAQRHESPGEAEPLIEDDEDTRELFCPES